MPGKKCLLVLGMHRSGTSAMSGILAVLKIKNNARHDFSPDNIKGGYEHGELVRVNETILKKLQSSWDDVRPFADNWFDQDDIKSYADEIAEIIIKDFQDADIFTIKDPRISVLLPLYLKIFKKINIEPLLIVMDRKDQEICLSLKKRNRFSVKKASALCNKYKSTIQAFEGDYRTLHISFDDLVNDPVNIVHRLVDYFLIELPVPFSEKVEQEILDFIDPGLKHHSLKDLTAMEKLSLLRFNSVVKNQKAK